MIFARRTILGTVLALSVLAVAIPGAPAQNPSNPKGIDVSVYQGTINWTSVKNAGISYAIIRAGHGGTTGVDTTFATNWAGAKAAGLVRGAYWYVVPSASPSLSANAVSVATAFVNTVKPQKGDLQLAIDFEDNSNSLSKTDMQTWMQACVNQIKTMTHRPPMIYCSPSFWNSAMPTGASNMGCPLWIAHWFVSSPTVPSSWSTYAFWQYNDNGSVSGISGNVDSDTFNGGMATMLTYTYSRDPLDRR